MSSTVETFRTDQPLLSVMLQEIGQGKRQLPDFQRGWVWDDEHIRSLIASVTLAYPIGAVMVLETGGNGVRFLPRPFEGVELQGEVPPSHLVLDGQQRLTSLYLALCSGKPVPTRTEKGQEIKRYYYLNMALCLDSETDRLDAVVSMPESLIRTSAFGREVELDLSSRDREYETGMFPLRLLFDSTAYTNWCAGFRSHFQHDPKKSAFLDQFAMSIWLPMQQYKIPVIELLKGTPKEAVCQVFEKVNTGGVTLSVFELMTATYAADDFRLREDWLARQERLQEHDLLRVVDGTDFLQAVTLAASYRRNQRQEGPLTAKRKDVLRLSLQEFVENQGAVEAGFVKAVRLLSIEKVFDQRNLPYTTQLIPLAVVCAFLSDRFEEELVRQKLSRWYWCGVFGEMYGGANETRYANDVQDLLAWIQSNGEEPRTIRDASFSPLRLLTLQSRQSAAYKGLFSLMVQSGSRDFMNGDPIDHTTGFALPVDIHHIFPRAWCERNKLDRERWNSVINKAPLTSKTNNILGGRAPSEYLDRLLKSGAIVESTLHEVLRTHGVKHDLLRNDAFDAFLRDRATWLLSAIERAMGKPIQGRDGTDVVSLFGEPL